MFLQVLEKAYELGVTHFDTAEVYAGKNKLGEDRHNEALVGQFLKKVGRDKVTSPPSRESRAPIDILYYMNVM
jgi:aryl-alcohol dehydrogenase-like predicted oxidoreductase